MNTINLQNKVNEMYATREQLGKQIAELKAERNKCQVVGDTKGVEMYKGLIRELADKSHDMLIEIWKIRDQLNPIH